MKNRSISQRISEIDAQISELYRERHLLEMEQQRHWEEMGLTGALTANANDMPSIEWMADSEDNLDRLYEYGNTD